MDTGVNAYDLVALALAPVVAVTSIRVKRGWILVLVVIVVGLISYGLLAASVAWTDARLGEMFDAIPRPTPEQMRQFSADGASKAVFFLFGFPVSLLYAVAWFLLVRFGRILARRLVHA